MEPCRFFVSYTWNYRSKY